MALTYQSPVMSNNLKFPLWFSILTGAYGLSNLFVFGGLSLISPETAFPDAGPSAVFPIQFFAIRHIALGFPLLYGLVKKNTTVLLTCYSIFFVITTMDVALLFINDYYVPVIGELPTPAKMGLSLGGFIGPVVLALRYLLLLNKKSSV